MSEETLVSTFTILRRRLRSIAMHLMPHGDDADDALQEAFCRLWLRRDTINSTQEAEALAATTLRNISIDRYRKRKIETVPIDEQHDREEDDEGGSREELIEEVESIMSQELTALQKEIIERKEYNGETTEEIAKSLGMQEAAVRMQLSRARKKIRECYQKRKQQ